MGCKETIRAIRVADIPFDKAKKTPPKYKPWNNNPLIDASIKALREIYLFFEKKMKNKKKKNATIPNLIESDRKGEALSTIILLVINADDHSITKIIGIMLKIWITFLFGKQLW